MKRLINALTERAVGMVLAAIAGYAFLLGWIGQAKYRAFGYTDFDLAVHAQSVWNILHGSMDSSILGIPFLGNHMALILYLVAPLYALCSSPLLLLHLQTAILALGAWGIYKLARRELSGGWGLAFALFYLIYPPLIYMNLYEFHPIALATTFLIFATYFYRTERFGAFWGFLALAMLCQENVALIAMAFGIHALIERRSRRWIWVPIAVGLLYFVLIVVVVMPRLNRYVQMYSMYSHLGASFPEVLKNAATHPALAMKSMWNPERLTFFNLLFAPLGYLSLLSPFSLIPAVPIFLQRLLSSRATESALIFHYQAEFIPFVFAAAIHGLHRVLNYNSHPAARKALVSLLLVFPVLAFVLAVAIPGVILLKQARPRDPFLAARQREWVRQVPPDAAVVATFEFLAPLSNRRELYSLHHVYSGRYTLSTVPYPLPPRIDYVFLNTQDRLTFHSPAFYAPSNYLNLQTLLAEGTWILTNQIDPILVFHKTNERGGGCPCPAYPLDSEPPMNRTVEQENNTGLQLVGFTLEPLDADRVASLTLYWRKASADQPDFDVHLTLSDDTPLYEGVLAPGSRVWPSPSWPTHTVIADRHRVHLRHPPETPERIRCRIERRPLPNRETIPGGTEP